MRKEMSPQERAEEEKAQKRELLEEVLVAKLLREMPDKTPIEVGRTVFRVQEPYAFQELEVIKVEGDKAEVAPQWELYRSNQPTSMLKFSTNELWDDQDYFSVLDMVHKMNDQELKVKISQPSLVN